MSARARKLTVYFGERARIDGGRFVADALADIYERHELAVSVVLRAISGFGPKHRMRTDRLLSLSEDLPLVSAAVDSAPRIEAAAAEVATLPFQGLVTVEHARLVAGTDPPPPAGSSAATKLTVYVGRHQEVGRMPADRAVVALLHQHGIAGATVLLGIDGTAHGRRRRARFFAGNADVPVMVIAVGDTERIAGALPALADLLPAPLITLEDVTICKREGQLVAPPPPGGHPDGAGAWQKLMVFAGAQSTQRGRPLADQLVRDLRSARVSGATSLRGTWGYHGAHRPHGDTLWQLRRRVPTIVVVVDTPQRIQHAFAIADELTAEAGLVTSEWVPVARATGPGACGQAAAGSAG